jgi:hypothetical protein
VATLTHGLFDRPGSVDFFPVGVFFGQRAGPMRVACWSCASLFGFGPPASRCAFRVLRPVVACREAFVPETLYTGAPSGVSGANQAL